MPSNSLTLSAPTVEQHPTGLGVGVACPRVSWRFLADSGDDGPKDWEQKAYDIEISRFTNEVGGEINATTTETHHVASSDSVLVPWPSKPLRSREQVRVRVRAYGNLEEEPTEWSPYTLVEAALLHRDDWHARPITSPTKPASDAPIRPVRFFKDFHIPHDSLVSALTGRCRLYITALGVYNAWINGKPVGEGDYYMSPGWTSYKHRLNYQIFDIAPLLNRSELNVISVEVGEGWYAGRLGFLGGERCIYGDEIGVLVQLEIDRPGGSPEEAFRLVSDSSWVCHPSAIVRSEIYDGELYDARQETPGKWNGDWLDIHKQVNEWEAVRELELLKAELVAPDAPPVRVIESVSPVAFVTTPSGKTVLDFGQNLVGKLLIHSLTKPSGQSVSFTHAEVLEKDGELGTRPLRIAKCADTIISAGEEIKGWSPSFTFHGFRYVQVDGWSPTDQSNPLELSSLSALVIHTDMQRTGWFSCSHPMVNQLHQNALWSMRGNFLSIPTDCPQRDERLGWTGDIQVFGPSANYLYNTAGMLGGWLRDVAAEHLEPEAQSIPPFVIPNVIQKQWPQMPQAVWDDVVVLLPWALYRSFGDVEVLRRQYASMQAWIDKGVLRGPDRLWKVEQWQLGDWLDPTAPPDQPGNARTDGTLVADAYLVHVTGVLARISQILNDNENASRYKSDFEELRSTFQAKYIAPSGLLVGDTQTALSLAIMFDLYATPEQLSNAAERLSLLVRRAKFRVATGFAGTPIITHALTKTGNHQIAYRMLLEKNRPSWMYPITMGATSIWERWDSLLPDGSINPGEMTSFNHYALGSVVNWLHESVAGIRPVEPGWKTFRVAPVPGGTVDSAEAAYETAYGRVECRWEITDGDGFELRLLVPPNSRALVILPHERKSTPSDEDDGVGRWVGSGRYTFEGKWNNLEKWPPKPLKHPFDDEDPDSFV